MFADALVLMIFGNKIRGCLTLSSRVTKHTILLIQNPFFKAALHQFQQYRELGKHQRQERVAEIFCKVLEYRSHKCGNMKY